MKRQTISKTDLELLANQGREYPIGGSVIIISPLSLGSLPGVIKEIASIRGTLKGIIAKVGGRWTAAVPQIAEIVAQRAPGIGATLVNVELSDFRQLPVGLQVDLILTAIEVNLEASGDLIKNLVALAGRSQEMIAVYGAIEKVIPDDQGKRTQ